MTVAGNPSTRVGRDGSGHALELELTGRLDLDQVLDGGVGPLAEQDLAGLRLAAQAGGEDDRVADRGVVVATFEADPAERRVAGRDADPETELVAELAPALGQLGEPGAHRDRHRHRPMRMVVLDDRVVEEHEDPVAGEVLERAAVLHHQGADRRVVGAEDAEQLFRLGGLAEVGEAAQVGEDRRDLAPMAGQELLALGARHERRDLGRHEPGQLGPLALDRLEQPGVLDGDGDLLGEGRDERDLGHRRTAGPRRGPG